MSTKIIIVRGQVMMQTGYGASQARRTSSNSQDTFKLKKSGSATSKLKTQLAAPMMLDSIKKSRLEHSKSNKKSSSQVSHNNKSVKVLAELQISQNNVDCSRTGLYRKQERDTDKKTGTIPVKNIKEKIIGRSFNESPLVNSVHSSGILIGNLNKGKQPGKQVQEKENIQELRKMKENLKNRDYHYYHNEKKKNVTPRENCDESLLNFSCMLTNAQGLTLDMFEVGRKLGKGRFGDVYMAKDVRTGFMLALKMINKRSLKESQMQTQLMQQIKIQSFSEHPNVLKMYGFFADEAKIYLLLQLATNGCLFKEIRSKNCLEESQASFYFRQVASGVRYLHGNFVIHRDIKPENILNCFNVLKICDFGWATYSPLYQRQTFCGTLDYVPPEIVTGEFYDEKADLWCLGVLCYQLVTGRAPFESKTNENETYDKILKVEIEFPIYLSALIVDFIGRILHREPSKRMSMGEIESHEWMRKYENETGRMISKQIWDKWILLSKNEDPK